MNALQTLSSQQWVDPLGWTLVHFLWQGVAIAVAYAIVRRTICTRTSNARYLLACGALAAMMLGPIVTWNVLRQSSSEPVSSHSPAGAPIASSSVAHAAPSLPSTPSVKNEGSVRLLRWVVGIWLLGAIGFWGRLVGGWIAAARMRSAQVRPASYEWQAMLTRLGSQIGVAWPVQLLVSGFVQVPTVVGWIRPVVLMPIGALAGLPAEQVEALLLHELAHIRRHDYLVNILQGVIEAILFYHPTVWWISGHIRTERELCCDDIAVAASGDVLTYARALADLEAQRPAHLQTAMAANGGSLAPRIARLLGQPKTELRSVSGPGVVTAAALTLAIACGLFVILVSAFTATAQTPAQSQAKANLTQGVAAFDQSKFQIAAGYLEQALKLDPNLTDAQLYLARAAAMQYVPGERSSQNEDFAAAAVKGFENVLQKEPKNVVALVGLAKVYQNTMALLQAHDLYIQVAQLRPLDPAAFYAVGSINWMLSFDRQAPKPMEQRIQLVDEGIRYIDIALALDADHFDAMTYRNLLLREKAMLTSDPVQKNKLTAEADDWFNKALQTEKRLAQQPSTTAPNGPIDFALPPPPPPPPMPRPQAAKPPAFEVASIKRAATPQFQPVAIDPQRFRTVTSLFYAIAWSFDVETYRVIGGPAWVRQNYYELEGRTAARATPKEMQVMLQTLLADRFKLKVHRETRELPVYALITGNTGSKLPASTEPCGIDAGGCINVGPFDFIAKYATMKDTAATLSNMVDRPVLDFTGLSGRYDFHIQYDATLVKPYAGQPAATPPPGSPSIFAAIQDFGLKLEPRRAPVEMLVIDNAAQPSLN